MKKLKRFKTTQNLLVVAGGILVFLGLGLVAIAMILSSISFRRFEPFSAVATQLGPILVLGGASIALFFAFWVTMPPEASLRSKFLLLFIFNQITGVMLLGGLLTGLVGYYWMGNEQIGRRGFTFHAVGWGLMLIRLYLFRRVISSPPDD